MKRVPAFETPEEEAQFWDEVDLTDLEAEEVTVTRPNRPLSATFAVRLDEESVEALRLIAHRKGIGATQLARLWILERIRLEEAAGELANPAAGVQELRIRRAVIDDVGTKLPDLVAAALLAEGVGATAGKAASPAKRKRGMQHSVRKKQSTAQKHDAKRSAS